VFLTTNHPHLIDEAAIRSGRVDFRLELGLCDRDQLLRMFLKFIDDADASVRFADAVEVGRWSPAQVQERLLKAADVDEAIDLFGAAPIEDAVPRLRAA
jgi:chaperone BCS1